MSKQKKEKMQILFNIFLVFLILIFTQSCRNNNDSSISVEKKENFILKPENVFQKKPLFFKNNRYLIELNENSFFVWKIKENIKNACLKFSSFIFSSDNKYNKKLSQRASITVIKKSISGQVRLIEAPFGNKKFEKKLSVKKGDRIVFCGGFKSDKVRGLRCGISIPKIVKLDKIKFQANHNNLIIISIDTVRADYFGIYKELLGEDVDFSYSPNMDDFARHATIFLNAYSPQSYTWPALSSLFLSLYPTEHGVLKNGEFLEYNYHSIASFMLNLGYNTISLNANAFQLNIAGFEEKYNFFDNDFALIDFVLNRLKADKNEPFFHWYHFMGTHAPYIPPKWVMNILESRNVEYKRYHLKKIMQEKIKLKDEELQYIRKLYAGEFSITTIFFMNHLYTILHYEYPLL
jgi:hypothetical protein